MQAIDRYLITAFAAVILPLLLPTSGRAQSIPPGRVTHRQFKPMLATEKSSQATGNNEDANAKPMVANSKPAVVSGKTDANGNPVDAGGYPLDDDGNRICKPRPEGASAPTYAYPAWFPVWKTNCHTDDEVEYFYSESSKFNAAEQAQYLYNAQQSASVISADLLTATFQPGLQVVLAGSATAGSSSGTTTTTTTTSGSIRPHDTTTTTSSTDSAATAVSKLETGGDFNLRFVLPMLWTSKGAASLTGNLTPNVGFNVNGLSSQNTITNSTQYAFNLPVEFYGQLASTAKSSTPAVVFLDVKPQGEFISKTLAAQLGPSVPTAMFLGEASIGIEFVQKVRISGQYVYGNASIFKSASTVATNGASTPTSKIGGFHLVVSFSK